MCKKRAARRVKAQCFDARKHETNHTHDSAHFLHFHHNRSIGSLQGEAITTIRFKQPHRLQVQLGAAPVATLGVVAEKSTR